MKKRCNKKKKTIFGIYSSFFISLHNRHNVLGIFVARHQFFYAEGVVGSVQIFIRGRNCGTNFFNHIESLTTEACIMTGNRWKSLGARLGEYSGCLNTSHLVDRPCAEHHAALLSLVGTLYANVIPSEDSCTLCHTHYTILDEFQSQFYFS